MWTWFIARACHIELPLAAPLTMALAVWVLYAIDRLLDARHLSTPHAAVANDLEARHLFHHRHRRAFTIGIMLAVAAMAALLPRLNASAVRLYLLEGILLVAWFLILHATSSAHRLPKEIAVGLFFSAAIFIPTVAREPILRSALFPAALLFSALCNLNCLFIYAWEHDAPQDSRMRQPHPTTRLAVEHLPALAIVVAVAGAAIALLDPLIPKLIPIACALAAVALLVLDRKRRHLSNTNLRAAADLALLTPALLLPFLR
jgi:hypothetical protein